MAPIEGPISSTTAGQALTRVPQHNKARKRRHVSFWTWFWLIMAALYFLVPLYSTLQFSLETGAHAYGFKWYSYIFNDPMFRTSFLFSLRLAVETVVIGMVLMVPTVYWVHLRLPQVRPVMDLITILPFVVPPVALVVGLSGVFNIMPWLLSSSQILAFIYVILALPFTYRSLDAGMRAINVKTLTEAAQSVGAPGWNGQKGRTYVFNGQYLLTEYASDRVSLGFMMSAHELAFVMSPSTRSTGFRATALRTPGD